MKPILSQFIREHRPLLVAVVIVAVVIGVRFVIGARSAHVAVSDASAQVESSARGTSHTTSGTARPGVNAEVAGRSDSSAQIVVAVDGCVSHPGVYRLARGARVGDAVAAAGGYTAQAQTALLNRAVVLKDQDRVFVASRKQAAEVGFKPGAVAGAGSITSGGSGGEEAGSGGTAQSSGGGTPSASSPVDINSATEEQLESLPGIGPATGAKIIADRAAHGRFASLSDLTRVAGIGEKKVAALKGLAVCR